MKNIQLVTSTYNDIHRFTWKNLLDFSKIDIKIYRKCDDLEIGQYRLDNEFIDIQNFGSCDYAFFYHIVKNYNNLADFTIFTKMNLYEDYFRNFDEIFRNPDSYDFQSAGGTPISFVFYNNENIHLLDLPTKYSKSPLDISKTKKFRKKHDGHSNWSGLEYEYAGNSDNIVDWFVMLYGNTTSAELTAYQLGPCFSVSRDLILRHPLSVYEYFLNMFHPFNSWDFEIASKYFKTDDVKKQSWGIGRHYHDNLLRFYPTFFTFGIDKTKYKIKEI